jgi:uncharacterized protein (UPF0333 family)
MEYLAVILIVVVIVIMVAYLTKTGTTSPIDKLQELKRAYEQALTGNNKRAALDAGRIYYGALRENKTLTVYDEQAIANDLSTMSVQPVNTQHWNSSQL